MKISIKQTKKGVFSLVLGDAAVSLDQAQMKKLLLEAVSAMAPGAIKTVSPEEMAKSLAAKIKLASPAGLQKLIMSANDDDIVRFLKSMETDTNLLEWMFENMSDRKQTMFREDMEFRYREGVPDDELTDSIANLEELTNQIKGDGKL